MHVGPICMNFTPNVSWYRVDVHQCDVKITHLKISLLKVKLAVKKKKKKDTDTKKRKENQCSIK
jgi:hypothetical protein